LALRLLADGRSFPEQGATAMDLGVFIPIGNNGWLTFELNK
jgi:hypothetical protein